MKKNQVLIKILGGCSIGTNSEKADTQENTHLASINSQLPSATETLEKRSKKNKLETEETVNLQHKSYNDLFYLSN